MKKDPRRRKENVQSQVLAHRFVKTDLATGRWALIGFSYDLPCIVVVHTGRCSPITQQYSRSILFVSLVNPVPTNDFGDNALRKIKSDRADAIKIVCPVLALSVRSLYEAQDCCKGQMESLRLHLYIVCL